MKRLIAFSSVGHMGFVMLGISTLTDIGINASIIGMVAHGLITGLLFFLAGSMSHRYHTREMARLGGNLKLMPILGSILAFTAFASLGLPGLAGFWGEFMSLLGAYNPAEGLPSDAVPDRDGAGCHRHGAHGGLHAVDAAEGQSRRAQRRSGKVINSTTSTASNWPPGCP